MNSIDLSKIRIDFPTAIPYDKSDPCFLEHLRMLLEDLSVPNALRAACVHEAGHLTYFRLLGATLNYPPSEFKFVRPYVSYDLNKNTYKYEFDHAVAATTTPFNKDTFPYTAERLVGLAKACFAGGVVTNEFAKGSSRGDGVDRIRFHGYYKGAIKRCGAPDKQEAQLEAEAIIAVTADLQDSEIRKRVLALADQCELECLSDTDSTNVF
jgi:hypothetical protein